MTRIAIEWTLVALLALIAALRKKKLRLLTPLLVTGAVTFFALLTPAGKVLIYVYSFPITELALIQGLHKSAILNGMVFFSQIIVSKKIHLPGKAGAFLQEIFADFENLSSKSLPLKKGHFISSLDQRLNEVYPLNTGSEHDQH